MIDQQAEMSDLRLNLLDQLLKIIKVFIAGAIRADSPEVVNKEQQVQQADKIDTTNKNEQELA